jgi:hypothetical protein
MSDAEDINRFLQAGFAAMGNNKKPIMCAVCEKPVEKIIVHQDTESNTYHYEVCCHGETDSVSITRQEMAEMTVPPEPSYAFIGQPKRIEHD